MIYISKTKTMVSRGNCDVERTGKWVCAVWYSRNILSGGLNSVSVIRVRCQLSRQERMCH